MVLLSIPSLLEGRSERQYTLSDLVCRIVNETSSERREYRNSYVSGISIPSHNLAFKENWVSSSTPEVGDTWKLPGEGGVLVLSVTVAHEVRSLANVQDRVKVRLDFAPTYERRSKEGIRRFAASTWFVG